MLEHRDFQVTELRIDKTDKPTISGHAALFNVKSSPIMGLFREIILPGAFANSIKTGDVRALWQHSTHYVLGRTKNGTLELNEDKVGLHFRIRPPDTIFASDVLESIGRGDVDQMSFGFRTVTDQWRMDDGQDVRELHEVELFEISPVTFPAYEQTHVSVREIRSFYQDRMKKAEKPTSSVVKDEEFQKKMREREEFLKVRTPLPDPYDLRSIVSWASRPQTNKGE